MALEIELWATSDGACDGVSDSSIEAEGFLPFFSFFASASRGSSWQRWPMLRLIHLVHGLSCAQR
jgi:hypothetical protein